MMHEYAIDTAFKDVMFAIALGKIEEPFHVKDGYLLYNNRLCVTHNMCDKFLYESHICKSHFNFVFIFLYHQIFAKNVNLAMMALPYTERVQ